METYATFLTIVLLVIITWLLVEVHLRRMVDNVVRVKEDKITDLEKKLAEKTGTVIRLTDGSHVTVRGVSAVDHNSDGFVVLYNNDRDMIASYRNDLVEAIIE